MSHSLRNTKVVARPRPNIPALESTSSFVFGKAIEAGTGRGPLTALETIRTGFGLRRPPAADGAVGSIRRRRCWRRWTDWLSRWRHCWS